MEDMDILIESIEKLQLKRGESVSIDHVENTVELRSTNEIESRAVEGTQQPLVLDEWNPIVGDGVEILSQPNIISNPTNFTTVEVKKNGSNLLELLELHGAMKLEGVQPRLTIVNQDGTVSANEMLPYFEGDNECFNKDIEISRSEVWFDTLVKQDVVNAQMNIFENKFVNANILASFLAKDINVEVIPKTADYIEMMGLAKASDIILASSKDYTSFKISKDSSGELYCKFIDGVLTSDTGIKIYEIEELTGAILIDLSQVMYRRNETSKSDTDVRKGVEIFNKLCFYSMKSLQPIKYFKA